MVRCFLPLCLSIALAAQARSHKQLRGTLHRHRHHGRHRPEPSLLSLGDQYLDRPNQVDDSLLDEGEDLEAVYDATEKEEEEKAERASHLVDYLDIPNQDEKEDQEITWTASTGYEDASVSDTMGDDDAQPMSTADVSTRPHAKRIVDSTTHRVKKPSNANQDTSTHAVKIEGAAVPSASVQINRDVDAAKEASKVSKQSKVTEDAQTSMQYQGTENVHAIAASAVEDAEKTEPEDSTADSLDEAHTMAIMMGKEDAATGKNKEIKSVSQSTEGKAGTTKAESDAKDKERGKSIDDKAAKAKANKKDTSEDADESKEAADQPDESKDADEQVNDVLKSEVEDSSETLAVATVPKKTASQLSSDAPALQTKTTANTTLHLGRKAESIAKTTNSLHSVNHAKHTSTHKYMKAKSRNHVKKHLKDVKHTSAHKDMKAKSKKQVKKHIKDVDTAALASKKGLAEDSEDAEDVEVEAQDEDNDSASTSAAADATSETSDDEDGSDTTEDDSSDQSDETQGSDEENSEQSSEESSSDEDHETEEGADGAEHEQEEDEEQQQNEDETEES